MLKGILMFLNNIFNFSGTATINDVTHNVKNSLVMQNGRVIVDGVDVTKEYENVSITIHGDVKEMQVTVCKEVTINGNVGSVTNTHGDLKCGNVTGDVETVHGDVECNNVGDGVKTIHGKINCGDVNGDVESNMGDIYIKGSVKGSVKNNKKQKRWNS